MAQTEPPKQPKGFLQNVAANALGGLIAAITFAAGSALFTFAAGHVKLSAIPTGVYGFLMLFGIYITAVGVVLTYRALSRPKSEPGLESLAFRIMIEEAGLLQKVYRRLSFDDPEHTRYPLSNCSWPNFEPGADWSYTTVSLYCLKRRFDWLVMVASRAFRELGWDEYVELFNVGENTVVIDLLPAFDNFIGILRSKVALVEGRK